MKIKDFFSTFGQEISKVAKHIPIAVSMAGGSEGEANFIFSVPDAKGEQLKAETIRVNLEHLDQASLRRGLSTAITNLVEKAGYDPKILATEPNNHEGRIIQIPGVQH